MPEYLALLKLSPGKVIDAMNALRSLSDQPIPGVDLRYTMNIFGTWDVGLWIDAENAIQVVHFVHKKIKEISGVDDVYTVPAFPPWNKKQKNVPRT
ncbi:MAG: hypothetical protein OEY81_02820 [Candidatus Bathyarchaeota archaeon]|nr:hypothetical protein [Candidatus Bathyarchaeota archaeon]